MTKNLFLWSLLFVLFAGCKKDEMPLTYNVIGTWTLYSATNQFPVVQDIELAQYPCIANNVLTIKGDSTSVSNYVGTSPCNVTPPNADYIEDLGVPGQAAIPSTWIISGNIVKFTYPSENNYAYQGIVSSVNGKLYLTVKDNFTYNSQAYTTTSVYLKE
jgi:hypothetical protein